MNIFREPFLNYLIESGISLRVEGDKILLPGFYKHGEIQICFIEEEVCVVDRYLVADYIGSKYAPEEELFKSLVRYNHSVWIAYKNRGYEEPSGIWLPHMLQLGLVKEKVVYE